MHGCLEEENFSSRVQLDASLVRCAHSWDIKLNTRRGIPHLCTPMRYSLLTKMREIDSNAIFYRCTLVYAPRFPTPIVKILRMAKLFNWNRRWATWVTWDSLHVVLVPGTAESMAREASLSERVFGVKQVVEGKIASTRKLYISFDDSVAWKWDANKNPTTQSPIASKTKEKKSVNQRTPTLSYCILLRGRSDGAKCDELFLEIRTCSKIRSST